MPYRQSAIWDVSMSCGWPSDRSNSGDFAAIGEACDEALGEEEEARFGWPGDRSDPEDSTETRQGTYEVSGEEEERLTWPGRRPRSKDFRCLHTSIREVAKA